MCNKCQTQRGDLSKYKMEEYPLKKTPVSFVRITPRSEGGHDVGTKARCSCGSEMFWSGLIQEVGSSHGGNWIAQCAQCKVVFTIPYSRWDSVNI